MRIFDFFKKKKVEKTNEGSVEKQSARPAFQDMTDAQKAKVEEMAKNLESKEKAGEIESAFAVAVSKVQDMIEKGEPVDGRKSSAETKTGLPKEVKEKKPRTINEIIECLSWDAEELLKLKPEMKDISEDIQDIIEDIEKELTKGQKEKQPKHEEKPYPEASLQTENLDKLATELEDNLFKEICKPEDLEKLARKTEHVFVIKNRIVRR